MGENNKKMGEGQSKPQLNDDKKSATQAERTISTSTTPSVSSTSQISNENINTNNQSDIKIGAISSGYTVKEDVGIIVVGQKAEEEKPEKPTFQILQALPQFEPFLWGRPSSPPLKDLDPKPLAATIDKIQNFCRVWSIRVNQRQAIISKNVILSSALTADANSLLTHQNEQLKYYHSQIKSIDKTKKMVKQIENQIEEIMTSLDQLAALTDRYPDRFSQTPKSTNPKH
eukprot:c13079_g1_i1.p1 GENE.c13079_g1_i1~~c13079_g1_i1.p1  ORF type:complete len:229 (-),score=88.27 c13079_g1_i1:11-697(-)